MMEQIGYLKKLMNIKTPKIIISEYQSKMMEQNIDLKI